MNAVPQEVAGFISSGRIGHLGTTDASGQPLVVPCCYAFDGAALFSAVDAKPKRTAPEQLTRVRNIRENPKVCVVIDEWSEDWSRLRHVIIQGEAQVLTSGADYRHGVELLLAKYEQYRRMGLDREDGVMIKVTPARVTHWSGAA
ncbi:MAG: TIGR03668 family PPOX class F420-dependent oxidoreductase [Candidatus Rokubacteria bacterium]|nr:TIGR03668 family PPOX class F420-dependent oxidoreductase [Candidatus Rokubacteria bacterium]